MNLNKVKQDVKWQVGNVKINVGMVVEENVYTDAKMNDANAGIEENGKEMYNETANITNIHNTAGYMFMVDAEDVVADAAKLFGVDHIDLNGAIASKNQFYGFNDDKNNYSQELQTMDGVVTQPRRWCRCRVKEGT